MEAFKHTLLWTSILSPLTVFSANELSVWMTPRITSNDTSAYTAFSQSVIAHELSHNSTALNSKLIYKKQSGDINEPFS